MQFLGGEGTSITFFSDRLPSLGASRHVVDITESPSPEFAEGASGEFCEGKWRQYS